MDGGEEVTEYQRGYKAAINGEPCRLNESEDWIRGFHKGMLDLSRVGKAPKSSGDERA